MSNWKIKVVNEAQCEFYSLPVDVRTRIRERLRKETSKEYPAAGGLHNCPGWFCIRLGKYRLIYAPYYDEVRIMLITSVGLRDNVYKELARRYDKYGR